MVSELETFANNTKEPFIMLYNKTVELLPGIIIALVMLFLGLVLSRWISSGLRALLNKIRFDEHTAKIGINDFLTRFGFGKSPTYVICFVISWAVMLSFIMIAADCLGLTIIRQMLIKLLAFIPYLFVCIVILFAGLLFGRFVQSLVENSAKANGIKGGILFAKIINIVIVVFAVILALEQIKINFALFNYVILILLASLGLAFGLAFGLGGKAVVEEYLRDLLKNSKEEKENKTK